MKMGFKTIIAVVFSAGVMTFYASAEADTIGVNFTNTTSYPIGATQYAGAPAVAQQNWNNVGLANSGSASSFIDSSGDSVANLSLSWSGAGWTSTGGRIGSFTGGDANLFKGYLSGGNGNLAVTVQNIPYASYDVYVYVSANSNWDRYGGVWLTNAGTDTGGLNTTKYYWRTIDGGSYTLATQTTSNGHGDHPIQAANGAQFDFAMATYMVFSGNTASKFVIHDDVTTWNLDVGIAGFQIVDTTPAPEPASLVIMLGGASLILARRKKA